MRTVLKDQGIIDPSPATPRAAAATRGVASVSHGYECLGNPIDKGISTGDFHEALTALLGPNAAGLSSTTISRLKADWWDEYDRWQRRDLSTRRFVYIWADGVYFRPRMAEEKQCVLVLIGADEWGRKEIIGLADGYRESTQRWRELLLDQQRRGLTHAPDLAIGGGALGFWNALREVFGATRCHIPEGSMAVF